jgi:hypothetical protein
MRPWYISRTADFILLLGHAGSSEEEGGGGWCANFEGEGAVRTDRDAGGDGGAGYEVCCSGVEFLFILWINRCLRWEDRDVCTLQKSMDFTPLLPRAGPTGGEGEACPAPTMSLTMTSLAIAFLAIGKGDGEWREELIKLFHVRMDELEIFARAESD